MSIKLKKKHVIFIQVLKIKILIENGEHFIVIGLAFSASGCKIDSRYFVANLRIFVNTFWYNLVYVKFHEKDSRYSDLQKHASYKKRNKKRFLRVTQNHF